MRFGIVAFVLTAVVAASPFAAEAGVGVEAATTTLAASSTTANATRTHHGHRNPHKEPTPTFKTSCDCERPVIPAGVFNDKEMCQFKHYVDMACYQKAQGGCPSPVLKC